MKTTDKKRACPTEHSDTKNTSRFGCAPHPKESYKGGLGFDHYALHFADNSERLAVIRGAVSRLTSTDNNLPKWESFDADTTESPADINTTTLQLICCKDATISPSEYIRIHPITSLNQMHIRPQLLTRFTTESEPTPLQRSLFPILNGYRDLLFTNRSLSNTTELRQLYCLHILNHAYKYRDFVLSNTAKLVKSNDADQNDSNDNDVDDVNKAPLEIRDQGFTRPKVLIIVPFRNSAYDIISILMNLSRIEQQENLKRFKSEFLVSENQESADITKPLDYQETFRGNTDDCFKVGIKFTRKAVRLFSQFYQSDVIVASPLGLRMLIGDRGDKQRDYDFLSSIEMVIVDQAHHINMQNWDHLVHIFEHLNLIPTQSRNTDFSRVRNWYLDGFAKHLRQTLLFSDYLFPELQSLFNQTCVNIDGRYRIKQAYDGVMAHVLPSVTQNFQRIDCTLRDADEVRFKYFVEKVLPRLRASTLTQSHTLVYIPSYFDYVRLRNYMDANDWNFEAICEYSSASDVTRSRTLFQESRCQVLLYTERFHFFRRYKIRGTKHVLFYGLPENADHYTEMVNCILLPGTEHLSGIDSTVLSLFTMWDVLKLERVVGTSRVKKMIEGNGTYIFA